MDKFPSPKMVDAARRQTVQPAIDRWCESLAKALVDGQESREIDFTSDEAIKAGVVEKIQESGEWLVNTGSRGDVHGPGKFWIKITRKG